MNDRIAKIHNRVDGWNLFFTLLFIALAYSAYRLLVSQGTAPQSIGLWDATLMALATFRLTRLVVYDNITRWLRDFFEDGREYTFVGTIKTLINCPWCMGLWFALIVPTAYFFAPFLWFFIFVLALAGAATLIQLFANLLGWSAEYRKLKTLKKMRED
jgi:hypothetical protein